MAEWGWVYFYYWVWNFALQSNLWLYNLYGWRCLWKCFWNSWGRVWVHHPSLSSGPPPKQWSAVAATAEMAIGCSMKKSQTNAHLHINKQWKTGPATAWMKIGGGFQQNPGDELKLYLRHTGSIYENILCDVLRHWNVSDAALSSNV